MTSDLSPMSQNIFSDTNQVHQCQQSLQPVMIINVTKSINYKPRQDETKPYFM